jgi:hypothetical protein
MLGVTVFGLILTPIFFYVIDRWGAAGGKLEPTPGSEEATDA